MKFITLVTVVAASVSAAFGLTINTPTSVVECEPTQLTWSGGSSPYFLSLVPAGQASATPFEKLPEQNGNTYTWNVDLASGTSFTIVLKDSSGAVAYSDIVTVQGGGSSSCVNTSAAGAASGSSSAASTSGSGSGSSAAGSTASSASSPAAQTTGTGATTAAGSSASNGSPSSTSSSSTASHSSSAGRLGVSSAFGVAGIMGLVGAALF